MSIVVIGSTCIKIAHPKNGNAMQLGLFLQLTCKSGFFFNPSPSGLPGIFQNPFYRCINNQWVSQNDFKSVLRKAPDCMGKSRSVYLTKA